MSEETDTTTPLVDAETREKMVVFVANNILNSVSLPQIVQAMRNVSLQEANTAVDNADEAQIKQIEASMLAAQKAADEAADPGSDEPSKDA
jgi:hypothetical protein